jgi:hypothetical protein
MAAELNNARRVDQAAAAVVVVVTASTVLAAVQVVPASTATATAADEVVLNVLREPCGGHNDMRAHGSEQLANLTAE